MRQCSISESKSHFYNIAMNAGDASARYRRAGVFYTTDANCRSEQKL